MNLDAEYERYDARRQREAIQEERRALARIERAAMRLVNVMAETSICGPSGDLLQDTIYHVENAHYERHGPPAPLAPRPRKSKPPTSAQTLKLLGIPCAKCGSTNDVALDHVIPEIAGGKYEEGNVQPLCRPCNSRKGGRTQ